MFTSPTRFPSTTRLVAAAALIGSAFALTACSTDAEAETSEPLTITDAWVKAVDDGMTGAFALIENTSDEAVTIVGATTDASSMVQLHETVADESGSTTMQEVDGGFTIEPGAALTLEPGGDHLMLMGVADPLEAGADVDITLELSDGTELPFTAVVKEFSGAQEEYSADMDGMDMSSDDSDMEMSPSASMSMDGE
ncbi:copper chaperone PCu(A)C [Demequina salsinemoris]|uniref:copper chaperone PCu(A)C n=1 Tax=Demequina salsinemoris TaxID=577470 RepID=UPI000A00D9EF|nr:copper chaperone PCu(A)C [Demequina salsinemoris]